MTDVEYNVHWYLGNKYGGSYRAETEDEIEEFKNEKIAQYGAAFRIDRIFKRYLE